MNKNKNSKATKLKREEWLDMTIFEQEIPTEKGTAPVKPNETRIKMKKSLKSICKETRKVLFGLEEICVSLPKHLPEAYGAMLKDAAFSSEQITRRLRHMLYGTTNIRRPDYLIEAGKKLDMTVEEHDGIVELTFPGLVPKAKSWKSSEYLTDPAFYIIDRYTDTHPVQRFEECVVCFIHEYDKALGIGRVLDYDNTEQKQLLDVVATFFLKDDGGLHCDAYHTTVLGEKDLTRILIMRKERFRDWLCRRYGE